MVIKNKSTYTKKQNHKKLKGNNKNVKSKKCLDYKTEKDCHKWVFKKHKYNSVGNPIDQCKWTWYLLKTFGNHIAKSYLGKLNTKELKLKIRLELRNVPWSVERFIWVPPT